MNFFILVFYVPIAIALIAFVAMDSNKKHSRAGEFDLNQIESVTDRRIVDLLAKMCNDIDKIRRAVITSFVIAVIGSALTLLFL